MPEQEWTDITEASRALSGYQPFVDQPLRTSFWVSRQADASYDAELFAYDTVTGMPMGRWRLGSKGIKPGHGLLMIDSLRVEQGERFVDLCSGPIAFFANFAIQRGASRATAIDINPTFSGTDALYSSTEVPELALLTSNLFENDDNTMPYDAAAFHPPMLPTPQATSPAFDRDLRYDYGGRSGREVLDEGIRQMAERIRPGGLITVGQFEFLGVDRQFGDNPCTFNMLEQVGFRVEQCTQYAVPATPIILASMSDILREYPDYRFENRGAEAWHRFVVVVARKS